VPRFQQYINNRNFDVDPETVCGAKGGIALLAGVLHRKRGEKP